MNTVTFDQHDDLEQPAEYEGLPPVTAQIKRRARKISGVEFSEAQELETIKKPKKQFSKRFEDNKTPESLLAFDAYQKTLRPEDKQFPTQGKTLQRFQEIKYKLKGPDTDKTTIAYQEKINKARLNKTASLIMQTQELPRCQANGLSGKIGDMLDLADYINETHRQLHETGDKHKLQLFFEDIHNVCEYVNALKSVYCDIPQARFIAREKAAYLKQHYKSLESTANLFDLDADDNVPAPAISSGSVAPSAIGGQSVFGANHHDGLFSPPAAQE